ncbi:MAG: bifunctional hydroxymethylpyrimidine kinase/phosphomethylpyrimidine kinase [Gemmatimonadota bacterium]|nr:bifunctional hydroxymethylpyrimidine kinase/phosphomethylpyrimidine kinase [Gemmatimonadota bacterium]
MKQVLTIAGSDSGGGAGIQADLKSFHANGAYGLSVITAVTAQNTREVRASFELPVDLIESQIDAIFDDFDVSAVKTGMLSSRPVVDAVAAKLAEHGAPNLVVDPVLISSSGFELIESEAVVSVKERLLPLAALVTPNLREAQTLAGIPVETVDSAKKAARIIFESGCQAVLVKGGHLSNSDDAVDVLYDASGETVFFSARLPGASPHGTGCTLSAAIAANLARGQRLSSAIENAKTYVTASIRHGLSIGRGPGPTHHFFYLDREP